MGPYCRFCDHRCFVERIVPGEHAPNTLLGATAGHLLMATCPAGMANDRELTGHDHTTAINPRKAS